MLIRETPMKRVPSLPHVTTFPSVSTHKLRMTATGTKCITYF